LEINNSKRRCVKMTHLLLLLFISVKSIILLLVYFSFVESKKSPIVSFLFAYWHLIIPMVGIPSTNHWYWKYQRLVLRVSTVGIKSTNYWYFKYRHRKLTFLNLTRRFFPFINYLSRRFHYQFLSG